MKKDISKSKIIGLFILVTILKFFIEGTFLYATGKEISEFIYELFKGVS